MKSSSTAGNLADHSQKFRSLVFEVPWNMKDSSVSPVGLLDPRRQVRILDGLEQRCHTCSMQQEELGKSHAQQRAEDEKHLALQRQVEMEECRRKRSSMLTQWDAAEEQLISKYESETIQIQSDLKRLSAVYRRKQAEAEAAIGRKVEARRQAILHQYENHKNQPGLEKRKRIQRINEVLAPIVQMRETAREITARRFDRLPQVVPAADRGDQSLTDQSLDAGPSSDASIFSKPADIDEALDSIRNLASRCQVEVAQLSVGIASRIVDSYYLPMGAILLAAFWALCAFVLGPQPPWIPMAVGIPVAGVLAFVVYIVLLLPLKKKTGLLYPRIETLTLAAENHAKAAEKYASGAAKAASDELLSRRDAQLASASHWQAEQITQLKATIASALATDRNQLTARNVEIGHAFTEKFETTHQSMHRQAETLARHITQHLHQVDRSLQQERDARAAQRHAQLQRLATRLNQGAQRAIAQIIASRENVCWRFPDWTTVVTSNHPVLPALDYLPLGMLGIEVRLRETLFGQKKTDSHDERRKNFTLQDDADQTMSQQVNQLTNGSLLNHRLKLDMADLEIPRAAPVVMHRRHHSAVVISAPTNLLGQAIDLAHQVLWRLISGVTVGRAKLTLIDPLGRGQHFTEFMALTDHDPAMVGHRVWTTDKNIEERLAELTHRVEDVLQANLRDRFQRIEDYNELAGSMAEPYRAIAAVGFPEGLTREGYKHLLALIESGPRCGIFTVLVCDPARPWPVDMPMPKGDRVLKLSLDEQGTWHFDHDRLRELPFQPFDPPPAAIRDPLVMRIGREAVNASQVKIPLDHVLRAVEEGQGNTDDGISIPIGSQGANRSLSLLLGEGVRQHVLIAGKTGSGKSTLLHSIITAGAFRYRPDQLQFYLLDFKKGVEFKAYADSGLPHVRVIGIESEREFGHSVLQRLDGELQHRGEQFRSQAVQSMGEFRKSCFQSLPRILLVIDEFQELFVRDDRLAGDCAMLLDRLVRQGRSFGMHVILSSQSLAGAYSLPRATLGQMAVRIAMQCSESDAAMILADDNTAARLISRPGEAIYNDAGGLIEGNHPFQVAWLSSARHREILSEIAARDAAFTQQLTSPVVFEGNRPCRWSTRLADEAIKACSGSAAISGLLGESVEIGPPHSIQLSRNAGRNVLLIAPSEAKGSILASTLSGFAKTSAETSVVYLDGNRIDDGPSLATWLTESGIDVSIVKPRDAESELSRLSGIVKNRCDESEVMPPIVIVIDPLERFRDLRQSETFNFSLDAAASSHGGSTALQSLLRDGPAANVFVMLVCGSAETLSRWLPRSSHHELELRVLGRMNASDSSALIDTPLASELSAATVLLYDDADGRITKFRQCDLPDTATVKSWLGR